MHLLVPASYNRRLGAFNLLSRGFIVCAEISFEDAGDGVAELYND